MRVLVIEDDASLNEIVCAFLASEGYRCTPAFSGSEARMLIEGAPGGGAGPGAHSAARQYPTRWMVRIFSSHPSLRRSRWMWVSSVRVDWPNSSSPHTVSYR